MMMRLSICKYARDERKKCSYDRWIVLYGIFCFFLYLLGTHGHRLLFRHPLFDCARELTDVRQYDDDVDEDYYRDECYQNNRDRRDKEKNVGMN